MTRTFRYVIDHDMGFSPNPFHGFCTLANCKPVIRRCCKVGDYVLGFGAAKSGIRGRLIYWLRVDEKISFEDYWSDPRFQAKKPILNSSLMKFYGDNIYWKDHQGRIRQEASFHSYVDGSANLRNLNRDTGSTNQVLVSQFFGYYGRDALLLSSNLAAAVPKGRGHRVAIDKKLGEGLRFFLENDCAKGFRAAPSGW